MQSRLLKLTLTLAASTVFSAAQAHSPWLLPSATTLTKGEWVSVDAGISTDVFVANHNPMNLDSLQVTAPDGTALKPENPVKLKYRSVFDLQLPQEGTYRIAVLNGGVFASWKDKATGQMRRARGTAESLAKDIPADAENVNVTQSIGRIETFVTVGKPSAIKPTGQGLELVTQGSPNDLVKGEKTVFTLLLDGQPAKDLEVGVTPGGSQYRNKVDEMKFKTDDKGQIAVVWPTAGMFWLDANVRDAKTTLPQAKERRATYAATLEVLP